MAEALSQTNSFSTGFALPALSLAHREIIRFLRQRSRVIGALATPILIWIFMGSGMGRSFSVPDAAGEAGYLRYAFTGTIALIVLFTSIFASISIIEDRNEGFLQSVLVSPAWRSSIAAASPGAPDNGQRAEPWSALAVRQPGPFRSLSPESRNALVRSP